jgi:hypothetical protein
MADDPFVDHGTNGAKLLVTRYAGINPVQLPQIDLLYAKMRQAPARLGDEIVGIAVRHPRIGAGPAEPALVAMCMPGA